PREPSPRSRHASLHEQPAEHVVLAHRSSCSSKRGALPRTRGVDVLAIAPSTSVLDATCLRERRLLGVRRRPSGIIDIDEACASLARSRIPNSTYVVFLTRTQFHGTRDLGGRRV